MSIFNFFKAGNKALVGAMDTLGEHMAKLQKAGAHVTSDTIVDVVKQDKNLSQTLATAYSEYIKKAASAGLSADRAAADFTSNVIDALPKSTTESLRNTPKGLLDASRKLAHTLAEESVSLEKAATPALAQLSKYAHFSPAELSKKQTNLAIELEGALSTKAASNGGGILQALSFMRRGNANGINNAQGMVNNVADSQAKQKTVHDILAEIAELRNAPNYERIGEVASDKKLGAIKKSAANVLDDLAAGKQISDESFRTLNKTASGGSISLASSMLRNPGKTLGTGLLAWVVGSTALTRLNPEEPHLLGKAVLSSIYGVTGDKEIKNDYSEFLYEVYSTNVVDPKASMKKYFGVDLSKKGTDWNTAITTLTTPGSETRKVIPEVRQGLLMYATMQVYNKPADTLQALEKIKTDLTNQTANALAAKKIENESGALTSAPINIAEALRQRNAANKPASPTEVVTKIKQMEDDSDITAKEATALRSAWATASKSPDPTKTFEANAKEILATNKNIDRDPALISELALKMAR